MKIKPCPFCGGHAIYLIDATSDDCAEYKDWAVHCTKCKARTDWYFTNKEAVEAWNKRVENLEYLKVINDYPTCNDCAVQNKCKFAPQWAKPVVYNCPFHISEEEYRSV